MHPVGWLLLWLLPLLGFLLGWWLGFSVGWSRRPYDQVFERELRTRPNDHQIFEGNRTSPTPEEAGAGKPTA